MDEKSRKIQVRLPVDVARMMKNLGGREMKLAAARGSLPMPGPVLVTLLFVFCYGKDEELKREALGTLRGLPSGILVDAVRQDDVLPEVLDLISRVRYRDVEVMRPLLANPLIPLKTLHFLAARTSGEVLDIIAANEQAIQRSPELKTLLVDNPQLSPLLKIKLAEPETVDAPEIQEDLQSAVEAEPESESEEDDFGAPVEAEDFESEDLSKYQQLLEMPVADKIKMALTGDKEWRTLLLREANKLVTSAVLKNPRITESEVVMVARNRAASDDMIRLILLNKEWVKLYEIKKALVLHPRTPLQKAMRFMGFLTEKDLKEISRSKQVAQAIVNNARRLLMAKDQKR